MAIRFQFSMTRLMIAMTLTAFTLASGRQLGEGRFAVLAAVLTPIFLMMTVCTFIKGRDGLLLVLCAAGIVVGLGVALGILAYFLNSH